MSGKHYRVISAHQSEFPNPLTFDKGQLLEVGERYAGTEGWQDWFFCSTEAHSGGWVPLQMLEMSGQHQAHAREAYTAKELNVEVGERLVGGRKLNGWIWCERRTSFDSGWVPLSYLEALD